MTHPLVVNRRKAPFDVYVGRPSVWGNPYGTDRKPPFRVDIREEAIEAYEKWLLAQPELVERAKRELKGKVLGCWCAPEPCHGEILARIANEERP
jgi:hypothetical protein